LLAKGVDASGVVRGFDPSRQRRDARRDSMVEWGIFIVFGVLAVVAAALVVIPVKGQTPLHAAIALIVSLSSIAGLYLLQAAHLVAVLQVLVYVGAVVMLFLFVIMLLNLSAADSGEARITIGKVLGVGAALGVAALLAGSLWSDPPQLRPVDLSLPAYEGFGWVSGVSQKLFTDFLVPFELISVFLLVAIVSAVVLAKREF
jgi:NADH-quinone oxidoreductase subunit J